MNSATNQAGDSDGVLRRMMRRIQLATGWGRVTFSDDSKSAQLLQVKLNDSETRDGTPRIAEFGFTSRPPTGSDVVIVFLAGDRTKGVVVATAHQASRPTNLQEGESMVYDFWGKSIYLTESDGIIVEAGGTPVTVNNATVVTISAAQEVQMNTPVLRVSGDIEAGGNIKDKIRTMAEDRALFNQHTNGTGTSTPSPQQ